MKLNKKYIIGTHVMFYEVEMISEFVESVYQAVHQVDNKDNITVDFLFNFSEYFEKIDTNQISVNEIKTKFNDITGGRPAEMISDDFAKIGSFIDDIAEKGKSPTGNENNPFNYFASFEDLAPFGTFA